LYTQEDSEGEAQMLVNVVEKKNKDEYSQKTLMKGISKGSVEPRDP